MSILRAITHGSAWRMGACLVTDVSHQTGLRWEARTNAALVAGARGLYNGHKTRLNSHPHAALVGWAVHAMRCDGTNAKVLHKESFHVAVVCSKYNTVSASG